MTVCVAAIAGAYSNDCAIVMVMDQMVSTGYVTADLNLAKGMRIHEKWFAMFSGNDVQYVSPIIRSVTEALKDKDPLSSAEVVDSLLEAYRRHRMRIAEQTVLHPLGLTMEAYVNIISTNDNETLRQITANLNKVEFSVSFLVCGFDQMTARIFSVEPPGVEGSYEHIGFWAVGSGAEAAINHLMLRQYSFDKKLPEAVYLVAESKFAAEVAPGVGHKTGIVVLRPDGNMAAVTRSTGIKVIRDIWQDEAQPPLPPDLETRIQPLLRFIKLPLPSGSVAKKPT